MPRSHRQLPCSVPLFHDETLDSLIRRLAAANYLSEADLRAHLGISRKTPLIEILEPLALAMGKPASHLHLALPEFLQLPLSSSAPPDDPPGHFGRPLSGDLPRFLKRPACRRCVQATGIGSEVIRWTTHERNVCLRHQLWTGDACLRAEDQIDVSILPGTAHAQRHHRNLITRHGRRWVRNAFPEARSIFLYWIQELTADPFNIIARNSQHLLGQNGEPAPAETALAILFHPQIVALTGLMAGSCWERQTAQNSTILYLVEEVTYRDILPGYFPTDRTDALVKWTDRYVAEHKFAASSGRWSLFSILFPEETLLPSPRAGANRRRPTIRSGPLRYGP